MNQNNSIIDRRVITMGRAIRKHPNNPQFVIMSDGHFTVNAICNFPIKINAWYNIYPYSNQYFVGQELNIRL